MPDNADPIRAAQPRNRIDVHVGVRLLQLRVARDMTREQLARRIGVEVSRLRAHEDGIARVTAAQLLALARTLDVPIESFFEGLRARSRSL